MNSSSLPHLPVYSLAGEPITAVDEPFAVAAYTVNSLIPNLPTGHATTSPSNNDFHTSSTIPDIDSKVTDPPAISRSSQSFQKPGTISSTTYPPSTSRNAPDKQTAHTGLHRQSASDAPAGGVVAANLKVPYLIPSSQHLSPSSTPTLGTITSSSHLAPETSRIHDPSSQTTATPHIRKSSPILTTTRQTETADRKSQYPTNAQTLSSSVVITVPGTNASRTPSETDLIVGTGTQAMRPSITAGIGSGPNGTAVQVFHGNALGARDGLWSPSMLLLVSLVVLFRL